VDERLDPTKRTVRGQALSIGLAIVPFGIAFGVLCAEADLSVWQAAGFSTLVFGGSAQFASVSILADGGTVVAATTAGMLLALRSLAFGVAMAPVLRGRVWWRALVSQLMIDESTAVGSAQPTAELRHYGYFAGGLSVFVLWNLSTLLGVSVLSGAEDAIIDYGIDATIPAAFLALLWPRLGTKEGRLLAGAGAAIALGLVEVTPAGVPIVVAAGAVVLAAPWRTRPSTRGVET
jgi:predicted branched-subunit amino acid permease